MAEVQVKPLEEVIFLIEFDVFVNIRVVATVSRHVTTTDAVALFLPPEGVPQLLEDGDPPRDPRPGGAGRTHVSVPRAAHAGPRTMECFSGFRSQGCCSHCTMVSTEQITVCRCNQHSLGAIV
mgnify:FL=1